MYNLHLKSSIIHFKLSIIHFKLSILHFNLSIMHFNLSIIHCNLPIIHFNLSNKNFKLYNRQFECIIESSKCRKWKIKNILVALIRFLTNGLEEKIRFPLKCFEEINKCSFILFAVAWNYILLQLLIFYNFLLIETIYHIFFYNLLYN